MIEQIEIYRKGLSVERLHTIRHVIPYSNGHHSANAALIAHELCKKNNLDSHSCILYMLMHDVAEHYVGDVPADVKVENPDLKFALGEIERRWEVVNLPDLPDLHIQEKYICKVSDLIELGMHCMDEIKMGNRNVNPVLDNVVTYLTSYTGKMDGLDTFILYFQRHN